MTRSELVAQIKAKKSFLCVGLDTDLTKIPTHLLDDEDPIYSFNKAIIEATEDLCVAYKPNIAFYECYGVKGWQSLQKTWQALPKNCFSIADAKRGDIGNTSKMYASALSSVVASAAAPAAAAEATTEDKAPVTAVFSDDAGQPVDILDLKGKVVFLNFWATWCPPCKAEMPSIQKLVEKFKGNDKVVFMLVEIEHEKDKAHAFLKDNKLKLPIYYPESEIPSEWLGQSIPTTVILDKDGRIAARHEGMADYDRKEVFEFITDLINK